MRILSTAAAAVALVAVTAGSEAQAARWCSYDGAAAGRCFSSQKQCQRTAGRYGDCRSQVAVRDNGMGDNGMLPGQIYPSRPYWASPYECFYDDGGGRFRRCNAGGDGGGRN
jgi:hypothetical protein